MKFEKAVEKIKLSILVNSVEATKRFLSLEFPLTDAWELKKTFKNIGKELEIYEELRRDIIIKLGTPIPGTNDYQVAPQNMFKYNEEIKALLEKEIEIELIKVKMEDLLELEKKTGKEFKIPVTDLIQLDWFIV